MKNIFLILFCIAFRHGLSQDLKVTLGFDKIDIKPAENSLLRAQHRVLNAHVTGGSGDYTYVWGSTNPYAIIGDRTVNQVKTGFNEEDITYRVFVKDNQTGKVAFNTINFKKLKEDKRDINLTVYPNPSTDKLTVNLEGTDAKNIPIRVELFNEKSTIPIKSIPKDQLGSDQYEFNTVGLPSGVYYVHVQYADTKIPKQVRVLINH